MESDIQEAEEFEERKKQMSVLATNNLTIRFGGLTAVQNFNLTVEKGQTVSIIGPNGAGKTTAFNMISGFYKPTEGTVIFDGQDITGKTPDEVAKIGICRTFQAIRLYRKLTVLENVLVGEHLNKKGGIIATVLHFPSTIKEEKEMKEKALELLQEAGLLAYKDYLASELSYGLQRKLEIVRALATNPILLLLDEPAAGMNPKETEDLALFINEIKRRYDVTILLIEHHMGFVMGLSDIIYVLDFGKTIAIGKPEEVRNNPEVIKAYLGQGGV